MEGVHRSRITYDNCNPNPLSETPNQPVHRVRLLFIIDFCRSETDTCASLPRHKKYLSGLDYSVSVFPERTTT